METYAVKISQAFGAQASDCASSIALVCQRKGSAERWIEALTEAVLSLDQFPYRYPLVEIEPWRSKGFHRMPVKRHIVYYSVNEEEKVVQVHAVVPARMDQGNALGSLPED